MRAAGLVAGALALAATQAGADSGMPPDFVDATQIVDHLATDIRYATSHNFTGAPVAGYGAAHCWLTREAAEALARVQADLRPRGLGLMVFDCYRPARAVRRFVAWAQTPGEAEGKREFFPDVAKADLFKLGYIAAHSGHARGSTVDVTLIDRATGRSLDMGTPFDLFGPRSHSAYPGLPRDVAGRRAVLRDAMKRRGFADYDKEWWHFTLAREPFPHTEFDVPIR